jgi:hypothetical protein
MAETFMKVSIENFRMFAQYIADNNLWDEVEQLLKSQGHTQIRISFDPTRAVAQLLKQKAAGDTMPGQAHHPITECICGGPHGPGNDQPDDDAPDDDAPDDDAPDDDGNGKPPPPPPPTPQ